MAALNNAHLQPGVIAVYRGSHLTHTKINRHSVVLLCANAARTPVNSPGSSRVAAQPLPSPYQPVRAATRFSHAFEQPSDVRIYRCQVSFAWLISTRWPSGSRRKQRISEPQSCGGVRNAAPLNRSAS
jgi:hypothetical protein